MKTVHTAKDYIYISITAKSQRKTGKLSLEVATTTLATFSNCEV